MPFTPGNRGVFGVPQFISSVVGGWSKNRKSLSTQQLDVLELLYKFRFGSNDLFAQYFGKRDRSFVFKRLQILLDRDLIGKRFEPHYRLQGKPAAYYLLPDGARALEKARPNRTANIRAIYKDKSVSEEFIEYCLTLFEVYCQLKGKYGNGLRFFTKSQLAGKYEYFEEFSPTAYLRLDSDEERQFFLEYFQSSKPFFTIMQRLKQYVEYAESGEWDATDSDFPTILIICETSVLQNRVEKRVLASLRNTEVDELTFALTNWQAFNEKAAWRVAGEDEPLSLLAL